jgi:KDO2-lipid IV(A) lauroyltransferase
MKYVGYLLIRLLVAPFRILPFWLLYVSADVLAFLLYFFGYRKKVVFDNLRRCFPEKNDREITAIAKASYTNLADVTLESLKSLVSPVSVILKRFEFYGMEHLNAACRQSKSVVLAGGHYNNWEWAALGMVKDVEAIGVIIYKTISNPYMDAWVKASRSRSFNTKVYPMQDTFSALKTLRGNGVRTGVILGADQSPSNARSAHWVPFFGQDTACLPGPDLIARQFDAPVFFFDIQRVRRGYYTLTYSPLCLEPVKTSTGEITALFMQRLEEQIRRDPGNWLWSHRRWKMSRSD